MIWIATSEKDTGTAALEKRRRDAADQFRANSRLKSQECSAPVLGRIFLRFAEVRFAAIGATSFRLIYKLHGQIQKLRQTHDLLLPCLLSGHVELKTN